MTFFFFKWCDDIYKLICEFLALVISGVHSLCLFTSDQVNIQAEKKLHCFFLLLQWLLVHCNYGQPLHGRCIIILYKNSFHKFRHETLCNGSSQSLHPYLLDNKPQHALFLKFSYFDLLKSISMGLQWSWYQDFFSFLCWNCVPFPVLIPCF